MSVEQTFSSVFAGKWIFFAFLAGSLIAAYKEYFALAAFLMFLFLLYFLSWLWGKLSLRKVSLTLSADTTRAFPGGSFPVTWKVENNKILPLIWLDIFQRCPKRDCAVPDRKFTKVLRQLPEEIVPVPVFGRKFAWVLSWQQLEWSMEYLAQGRGVCNLDKLQLVSGDGFGLSVREETRILDKPLRLVVYPRMVSVDLHPFLRPLYDCAGGGAGYFEDRTLMKSSRDYQAGDSFKSINWRQAAKTHKLQTNIYEKILPRAAFFILDTESFKGSEPQDFESTLEVLGSLILRLEEQQMNCGFALPGNPGAFHMPSCQNSGNILEGLAAVEMPAIKAQVQQEVKEEGPTGAPQSDKDAVSGNSKDAEQPEVLFFPVSEMLSHRDQLGQIYVAAKSPETLTCGTLLTSLGQERIRYIFCENPQGISSDKSLLLNQIRKGAAE